MMAVRQQPVQFVGFAVNHFHFLSLPFSFPIPLRLPPFTLPLPFSPLHPCIHQLIFARKPSSDASLKKSSALRTPRAGQRSSCNHYMCDTGIEFPLSYSLLETAIGRVRLVHVAWLMSVRFSDIQIVAYLYQIYTSAYNREAA
jgi:hypothetical protein